MTYYDIVVLGVVVSILFTEITQLSPAGLVVPGYIVLNLRMPGRILSTLAVALLALGIVKLLGNVMILYGRRSFAAMVLVSFLLGWLPGTLGILAAAPPMIGCLVSGIIARECDRQGILRSLAALAVVVGILALILLLLGHPALNL